jgi:hypothetical protein
MPEYAFVPGSIIEPNAQLLATLEKLSAKFTEKFNEKAADDRDVAKALQAAARALREQQNKNLNLQKQMEKLQREAANKPEQTALMNAVAKGDLDTVRELLEREAAAKKPPLTVLIDGSGSMTSTYQSGAKSPLQTSLDAVLGLSKAGTKVSTLLWGDRDLRPVEVTKDAFEKVSKGLLCGTEFMPVVDYMKKTTTDKSQNFVVVSDGDMFDANGMLLKMLQLLSSSPKTTLDFVVISKQKGTLMEKFAQVLSKEFPNQVRLASTSGGADVAALLHNIAARTGHSQKPMIPLKALPPQP